MHLEHFDFPNQFRRVYDHALAQFRVGAANATELFDEEQTSWLEFNGLSAQAFFDYAEDHVTGGEPGFAHALSIECVRRDYFINVQNRTPSNAVLDEPSMPRKHEAIAGIAWLPRLLPKARAKLRGELPPELMFCCGGDRHFFRTHDIMPAEFLNLVWRHFDNEDAIVEWVAQRIRRSAQK